MFAENVQWKHLYVKNAMNYELNFFFFAFVIEMLNILFCLIIINLIYIFISFLTSIFHTFKHETYSRVI